MHRKQGIVYYRRLRINLQERKLFRNSVNDKIILFSTPIIGIILYIWEIITVSFSNTVYGVIFLFKLQSMRLFHKPPTISTSHHSNYGRPKSTGLISKAFKPVHHNILNYFVMAWFIQTVFLFNLSYASERSNYPTVYDNVMNLNCDENCKF